MRAIINHRPEMDSYDIYLGTEEWAAHLNPRPTAISMTKIEPGDERPVFISLNHEHYLALRDSIIEREAMRLADAGLLRECLDRADELTDRLLTMLEQG